MTLANDARYERVEEQLKLFYAGLPPMWRSEPNAAVVLFVGAFTYSDFDGNDYRLPFCFEEYRMPEGTEPKAFVLPCTPGDLRK